MTLYSTLFNCGVEGEYQDISCQGAGRVSMNGSCLLNNSVSQTYTHSTPPNSHTLVRITSWDCSKLVPGWLYHKLKYTSQRYKDRQMDQRTHWQLLCAWVWLHVHSSLQSWLQISVESGYTAETPHQQQIQESCLCVCVH